ncbi:MAG TPA: hypothetical protein VE690_03665, partial [Rhodopila sp.]|nr:hypothetical protein [Rhodopila sp.]
SDIVSSAATPADAAINALLDRFMSACGQTPYGQTPRPGATATQKPASLRQTVLQGTAMPRSASGTR